MLQLNRAETCTMFPFPRTSDCSLSGSAFDREADMLAEKIEKRRSLSVPQANRDLVPSVDLAAPSQGEVRPMRRPYSKGLGPRHRHQ
jgi:hypothetical protein